MRNGNELKYVIISHIQYLQSFSSNDNYRYNQSRYYCKYFQSTHTLQLCVANFTDNGLQLYTSLIGCDYQILKKKNDIFQPLVK